MFNSPPISQGFSIFSSGTTGMVSTNAVYVSSAIGSTMASGGYLMPPPATFGLSRPPVAFNVTWNQQGLGSGVTPGSAPPIAASDVLVGSVATSVHPSVATNPYITDNAVTPRPNILTNLQTPQVPLGAAGSSDQAFAQYIAGAEQRERELMDRNVSLEQRLLRMEQLLGRQQLQPEVTQTQTARETISGQISHWGSTPVVSLSIGTHTGTVQSTPGLRLATSVQQHATPIISGLQPGQQQLFENINQRAQPTSCSPQNFALPVCGNALQSQALPISQPPVVVQS